MTVEVLRRAVQRQIEPACQWLETDGRSEGVVDERHQPMLARERRRGFEVRDLQERVCERLEVDRFRIAPHLRRPGRRRLRVDEAHLDAEPRKIARQQIVRTAVERVLREKMIARPEHAQQRRRNCRHAARGDDRGFRSFERRQLRVQRVMVGGVRQPRVHDVVVTGVAHLDEGG